MAPGHSKAISISRLIRMIKRKFVTAVLTSALGLIVYNINPETFTTILVHVRNFLCQTNSSDAHCKLTPDQFQERLVNIENQLKHMEAITLSMNNSVNSVINGQTNSSDAHCKLTTDHLQARLVNIENQLKRMETITLSMNNSINFVTNADCIVHLASYGFDDSTKYGYVRTSGGSWEEVLVLDHSGHHRSDHRGMTLMDLDIEKCTAGNRRRFDVHANPGERTRLLESLESKRAGTVIVGVTADTAENEDNASLRNKVGSFFGRHGMDISGLKFRGKLAFIMEIGNSRKTEFQIKANGGESLRMKIAVRHSAAHGVTFEQL